MSNCPALHSVVQLSKNVEEKESLLSNLSKTDVKSVKSGISNDFDRVL